MKQNTLNRNVKLLGLLNMLMDIKLYGAIAVLYFISVTHSMLLAMSDFSITMISATLFELPTGILSDKIGKAVESKHVESVDKLLFQTGKIQINKTHYAVVKSGLLFISYPENTISPWEYEFREGLIEIPSAEIEIEIVNIKDLNNIQNIHNNILDYSFDYDRIIGQLTIRSRKDGDKIRLLKRKCTKSLKKLFNEDNMPPQYRNSIAVISDDEGPLWIEGYGVAERCALCEETKKICLLFFRRANDA